MTDRTDHVLAAIDGAAQGQPLVKVTLVPVQVFGAECETCEKDAPYGLMDAVSAWSDCNRAEGHIYRKDDDALIPYRNRDDVITVYVPQSEMVKFDQRFGD